MGISALRATFTSAGCGSLPCPVMYTFTSGGCGSLLSRVMYRAGEGRQRVCTKGVVLELNLDY